MTKFRRFFFLGFIIAVVGGLGFLASLVTAATSAEALDYVPGTTAGGTVRVVGDLPLAEFTGDAETRGRAQGELLGKGTGHLLKIMGWTPRLLLGRHGTRFQANVAAISADDRAEITALAQAAGLPPSDLLEANALVDTQCSALIRGPTKEQPLMVARNMDYYPAKILGPGTLVSIVRGAGPRTYASIGWPGSIGVVSGMNDRGLVACVLLNHDGPRLPAAEPLTLRLRRMLAEESDVAGAVRRFSAEPVGSSHYVLLADATTACVVWRGLDGIHRDDLKDGWLAASNGPRVTGAPHDARGQCLCDRAKGASAEVDAEWMRQSLTASYMTGINAQAMLFIPGRQELHLARGTGYRPAALRPALRLELAGVFAGAGLAGVKPEELPAPVKLSHYLQAGSTE